MKIKITVPKIIDATVTNTQGKNEYGIALLCGGIMEDPYFHHENYQIIRADSEEEAKKKYNDLNNCVFYYADVVTRLSNIDNDELEKKNRSIETINRVLSSYQLCNKGECWICPYYDPDHPNKDCQDLQSNDLKEILTEYRNFLLKDDE